MPMAWRVTISDFVHVRCTQMLSPLHLFGGATAAMERLCLSPPAFCRMLGARVVWIV